MVMALASHPPASFSASSSSFFAHQRVSVNLLSDSRSNSNYSTNLPASICKASWQEVAGVVILSAIPFTAVKAIANSPTWRVSPEAIGREEETCRSTIFQVQSLGPKGP
ncbi:hypothetical protein OIU76_001175 [Salix suchowensis]|nr:hypothetical protein OIU76_001175 [Salix suchowensis]